MDYGDDGREAVRLFLEKGKEIGLVRQDFNPRMIEFIGASENEQ